MRLLSSVDTESRWTCTNTECLKFDSFLYSTVIQSIWWERHEVPPDCPDCGEELSFVGWVLEDETSDPGC